MIFLSKWMIYRFQPFIFQGVCGSYREWPECHWNRKRHHLASHGSPCLGVRHQQGSRRKFTGFTKVVVILTFGVPPLSKSQSLFPQKKVGSNFEHGKSLDVLLEVRKSKVSIEKSG